MEIRPTLQELTALRDAGAYRTAPVSVELYSDVITPIGALRCFHGLPCFLLESAEAQERWGRYSFIGCDPELCITARDGKVTVTGGKFEYTGDDVNAVIRGILERNRAPRFDWLPPFTGGLVGYFAYDYIKYSEPTLKLDANDTEGFQDMDLMLFRKVMAFDNYRQKLTLMISVDLDGDLPLHYAEAAERLAAWREMLLRPESRPVPGGRMTGPLRTLFDREKFCSMVEKAKERIFEGDIFQVVLSNRLEADFDGSLFDTYRVLRTLNPSPYMFYFSGNDMEVAGASPETLVKLEDGILHTFPLAGTRPRGKTAEEDERLERELLADEKERAEHNMLVDLGRNDLGKISRFGSVEVEEYMKIHRFSHVMHIGSTVRGLIREDRDALDAVEAVLPAGTLSGAPKLKACEIINELEDCRRGIYGGAIGYMDFTGNLDTCIAIRIAYKKNGKVFVRSGAGIVADSVPEREFEECVNKAKAVVRALEIAGEGLE